MKKNWIWKSLCCASAATVGIASPFIVSCSCSNEDDPIITKTYISIPDDQKTKSTNTNSVSFTFKVENDGPKAINTVDTTATSSLRLEQSSNILIDETTQTFTITVIVEQDISEWTEIKFDLFFSFIVNGQIKDEEIKDFTINNQVNYCDWISCEQKLFYIEKLKEQVNYDFQFDTFSHDAPEKINSISINTISIDPSLVVIKNPTDIVVDKNGKFSISVELAEDPPWDFIYFSFCFKFSLNGAEYISYSDEVGIYYNNRHDIDHEFLTFTFQEDGEWWLSCSDTTVAKDSKQLSYKINDGKIWTDVLIDQHIVVNAGDVVKLAGWNDEWSSQSCFYTFKFSANVNISGSVESIIHDGIPAYWIPNSYCFAHLFSDNKPVLINLSDNLIPFHCLTPHCYDSMFSGSVIYNNHLNFPAKVLQPGCYENMFSDCKPNAAWKLKLYCSFTSDDDSNLYFYQWLHNVESSTNCQISLPQGSIIPTICPDNWPIYFFHEPLTIVSTPKAYFNQIKFTVHDVNEKEVIAQQKRPELNLKYSLGYAFKDVIEDWKDFDLYQVVSLPRGEYIQLSGVNPNGFSKYNEVNELHYSFEIPENFKIYGSLGDLVLGPSQEDAQYEIPAGSTFQGLFANSGVEFISDEFFDSCTKFQPRSFKSMFLNAKLLNYLPDIFTQDGNPLPNAPESCYESMFEDSGLIDSKLDISCKEEDFGNRCFKRMFANCEFLTRIEHCSPASIETGEANMGESSFEGLFSGCIRLAICKITFTEMSFNKFTYKDMFYNCRKIQAQPIIVTVGIKGDIFAESCCESMFEGCTSLRNAFIHTTIAINQTLNINCFKRMYAGCSSLRRDSTGEKYITLHLPSKDDLKENSLCEIFEGNTMLDKLIIYCKDWNLSDLSSVVDCFKDWLPSDHSGTLIFRDYLDEQPKESDIPLAIRGIWRVSFDK